jgi:hypothetical protein
VKHGGVSRNGALFHLFRRTVLFRKKTEDFFRLPVDKRKKLSCFAVFGRVNAVHHIGAENPLGVKLRHKSLAFSGIQVYTFGGNRGGAYVYGRSEAGGFFPGNCSSPRRFPAAGMPLRFCRAESSFVYKFFFRSYADDNVFFDYAAARREMAFAVRPYSADTAFYKGNGAFSADTAASAGGGNNDALPAQGGKNSLAFMGFAAFIPFLYEYLHEGDG